MRDNSKDLTLERNYIQKWRFLIHEYQLVKAGKHPRFRLPPRTSTPSTALAVRPSPSTTTGSSSPPPTTPSSPRKRGPGWKSRRTLPYIEQKVLSERFNGTNRYEIYAILKPILKQHTP